MKLTIIPDLDIQESHATLRSFFGMKPLLLVIRARLSADMILLEEILSQLNDLYCIISTMTQLEISKTFSCATDFCRSFICEKIKLVVATCVVNLLVVVVFVGVAKGYCVLEIPPIVNFLLLFLALVLLAYCEALHYAVVSIEKWDMSEVCCIMVHVKVIAISYSK